MMKLKPLKKIKPITESRVTEIWVRPDLCVYIDEWYLEELIDILKEYPSEAYVKHMSEFSGSKKNSSFPQSNLASHRVEIKNSRFNEFVDMDTYLRETWFNETKFSLLKVNSKKPMHIENSATGSVVNIPIFLNNLSPKNMLTFKKEKSIFFKQATILINISGHTTWMDYKKIMRRFFKMYDFHSLSIGNVSFTKENEINYYRISVVKVRNGVNVNGQGLMLESVDFLRRVMFLIYEIDPTHLVWKSYGQTVKSTDLDKLKKHEPYFGVILNKYFNNQLIYVE